MNAPMWTLALLSVLVVAVPYWRNRRADQRERGLTLPPTWRPTKR